MELNIINIHSNLSHLGMAKRLSLTAITGGAG